MTSTSLGGDDSGPGIEFPQLQGLTTRLNHAARRAVRDRVIFAAAIGIAAALASYGALLLTGAVFDFETTAASAVLIVGTTALAVSAVGAAWAVRGRPTVGDLARAADRTFALRERVSTALQLVDRQRAKPNAIGIALLQDAEIRSNSVDPRTLSAYRVLRIFVVIAASAAIVAVALLVQSAITRDKATASLPLQLTQDEQIQVGDDLRRLAVILEQDGSERSDPFLLALAREVNQLGAELEAGNVIDREAVALQLDRLAGFTALAYQTEGIGAGASEDLAKLLEAMAEDLRPPPAARSASGEPKVPPPASERQNARPEGQAAGAEQAGPDVEDLLARAEAERVLEESPLFARQPGEAADAQVAGDYNAAAAEQEARRQANLRVNQDEDLVVGDGAQLAGPAADANAGESRLAGKGVEALEGEPGAVADPFDVAGRMLLIDELDGEGRRIRVEIPPGAMDIQIAPGEFVVGDWRRQAESGVTRWPFALTDRAAVARYFRAVIEAGE